MCDFHWNFAHSRGYWCLANFLWAWCPDDARQRHCLYLEVPRDRNLPLHQSTMEDNTSLSQTECTLDIKILSVSLHPFCHHSPPIHPIVVWIYPKAKNKKFWNKSKFLFISSFLLFKFRMIHDLDATVLKVHSYIIWHFLSYIVK